MATYRQEPFTEPRVPIPGGPIPGGPIPETGPELRGGNGDIGGTSLGSLLGELVGETTALMRAEIALARGEMQDNLTHVQRGAFAMAAGGAVLGAGLLALLAAAILALAPHMDDWLAALIVGGVTAICGAIMLQTGKHRAMSEGLKPQRTLGSFQEMREMARQEKQRATRKWR